MDLTFSRCMNCGICSKHFLPSSYKYPGSTKLCFGAEPQLSPSIEQATTDTIVEESQMKYKNTSPELCSNDVLRKIQIMYKRRHLEETPDEELPPVTYNRS